jgi:excinuclease UvrABC nuclease subunit
LFGPFSSRATADLFESQFLDLFQLRRCQEDLTPSPDHPGCIYGEMRRCLRPCQQAVTIEEYASEAERVAEFLLTRGAGTLERTAAARDRASENLEFEQAAQLHAHYDRIEAIAKVPGDLAADTSRLSGIAITRSTVQQSVLLWFLREGCWLPPHEFSVAPAGDKPVSIDTRLREILASLPAPRATLALRQDHLALLAKWFYSSWRDGEWFSLPPDFGAIPYRRLVNAINRVSA